MSMHIIERMRNEPCSKWTLCQTILMTCLGFFGLFGFIMFIVFAIEMDQLLLSICAVCVSIICGAVLMYIFNGKGHE